jgi:hypothetical protein
MLSGSKDSLKDGILKNSLINILNKKPTKLMKVKEKIIQEFSKKKNYINLNKKK